jgi:hypothetical protein
MAGDPDALPAVSRKPSSRRFEKHDSCGRSDSPVREEFRCDETNGSPAGKRTRVEYLPVPNGKTREKSSKRMSGPTAGTARPRHSGCGFQKAIFANHVFAGEDFWADCVFPNVRIQCGREMASWTHKPRKSGIGRHRFTEFPFTGVAPCEVGSCC